MPRREIGTDDLRVKVRPGKGSRPRTKDRPNFSACPLGMVTAVDRGRYKVLLPSADKTPDFSFTTAPSTQEIFAHLDGSKELGCVKARQLGRGAVVVGDMVRVTGDLSGRPDTLARIVEILPRRTQLERSSEDPAGGKDHLLVANADLMCIVTAAANPTPRLGMIDRTIASALAGGLHALIVVTKTDLTNSDELSELYQSAGVEVLSTRLEAGTVVGLAALRERLQGKFTVLVGHSGVGKSTLTNALVPGLGRQTGSVNEVTGRGRHVSTSAVVAPLPGGGFVTDTPGVRSFGLAHVTAEGILRAFQDLAAASENCPRRCSHSLEEPECALNIGAHIFRQSALFAGSTSHTDARSEIASAELTSSAKIETSAAALEASLGTAASEIDPEYDKYLPVDPERLASFHRLLASKNNGM